MKKGMLLIIALLSSVSVAQVPRTISYQGRLSDASGLPISGTRNITFSLYTTATGGSPIWTETHNNVPISNGLYNVMLGSVNPFPPNVDFSQQYWLGVQIGIDPELTPRYQLGATPYALNIADTIRVTNGKVFLSETSNPTFRVLNSLGTGILGYTDSPDSLHTGVFGVSGPAGSASGVRGLSYGNGYAVYATHASLYNPISAGLANSRYAGYFKGDVAISGQIISDVATGTKPIVVKSKTLVDSLNADMVDGYHASDLSAKKAWTIYSNDSLTIDFPHYSAFMLIVGEMFGPSEFTGMLICTENDGYISYTSISPSGVSSGVANERAVPAVELLNLGSGRIIVRTDGDTDWDHTLKIRTGATTEASVKLIY